MSFNEDNQWPERRKRVVANAEQVAMKHSAGRLPVPLADIARECRVKNIFLRPLLIDGGIALRSDGFVIYVRSKGQKRDLLEYSMSEEQWQTLSFRTYFTIAHEIAHTLFFYATVPPKPKYEIDHPKSIKSLEAACDLTASRMLFPEAIRRYEEDRHDFLDPNHLRSLSSRARLSARALVYRLTQPTTTPFPYGIICSVRHTAKGPVIEAVARHPGFQGVFPELKEGKLLNTILSCESFLLNGGDDPKFYQKAEINGMDSRSEICEITTESHSAFSHPNSFVTVRFADPRILDEPFFLTVNDNAAVTG